MSVDNHGWVERVVMTDEGDGAGGTLPTWS